MSDIQKLGFRNRLLLLLPDDDFQSVIARLVPIQLPKKFVLAEAGQPIPFGYFLESGIGSIVVESPKGHRAEAGLFGREGWAPTEIAGNMDRCPYDVFMQVAGEGHRIECDALLDLLNESPAFRKILTLFTQTLSTQTSFTALSNAVHHIDERLARWILMCHDRMDGNEIALTHEFLALMLAVRRPSVTTALHVLEGHRFIRSDRSNIIIRDRKGLEAFASDTYGRPEEEFHRLIGPM